MSCPSVDSRPIEGFWLRYEVGGVRKAAFFKTESEAVKYRDAIQNHCLGHEYCFYPIEKGEWC